VFKDVVATLHFRVRKKADPEAEGVAQQLYREHEDVCKAEGIRDGPHLLAHLDSLIDAGEYKPRHDKK